MKIKIISIFLLVSCVTLSATSCNNHENVKNKDSIKISEYPETYNRKTEKLNFAVDIVVDESIKDIIYKSTAKQVVLENDNIIKELLGNSDKVRQTEQDPYAYINMDNESLYLKDDFLTFQSNSELLKNINYKFSLLPEKYTADKFDTNIKNEGLADIDSKRAVSECLQRMGMSNVDLYQCFILENSYYWLGIQKWQGIPVFSTIFSAAMIEYWTPIQILHTDDDIEKAQVLYYFDFQKTKEQLALKSFDEVARALEEDYNKLLTDNKYNVVKAELFYWVDVNKEKTEFEMLPVWIFTLREYKEGDEEHYIEYQELINAETAEEMEVGE